MCIQSNFFAMCTKVGFLMYLTTFFITQGTCATLPSSTAEDIFCRFKAQKVSCEDPSNNTTAIIRCKPFHVISGNRPIYKCDGGVWDQPLAHCTLGNCFKKLNLTLRHARLIVWDNCFTNAYVTKYSFIAN